MSDDDMIRRGDAIASVINEGLVRQDVSAPIYAAAIRALPAAEVGVKPGQIERAVWSAMVWAAENNPGFNGVPEYTDGGNSHAETEARAAAARIRSQLIFSPAPGRVAGEAAPAPSPAQRLRADEGPQNRNLKTCKGCKHFHSEYWREPSGDGETWDSGTSATCLKANATISTYYGTDPSPPSWCPCAALAAFEKEGK